MFKTWYYKASEKLKYIGLLIELIDSINGADAFDEINGTKQMFAMISWRIELMEQTEAIDLMKNFHKDFC